MHTTNGRAQTCWMQEVSLHGILPMTFSSYNRQLLKKSTWIEMLLLQSPFSLRGWGQGEIEKVPLADVIKDK